MTRATTKADSSLPQNETKGHLFDNWNDPLETEIRGRIRGFIEELIHELSANYTVVIVTHNMQQAGRCSDYTAFLYLGRLIEFGSTTKIFSNPSERRTEDYITGRFG